MMMPCRLRSLRSLPALLWTTTTAAGDPGRRELVEVIASVSLREELHLQDGDTVEIEILGAVESSGPSDRP